MKQTASKPRTVKPLSIPPEQAVLAERIAILIGHGMFDKARAVIDGAELEWQTKRLESLTIDSPLSLVPGIKPRSVDALDAVQVYTIRQFLSYHMTDSLRPLPLIGEFIIADVLNGIRLLPSGTIVY